MSPWNTQAAPEWSNFRGERALRWLSFHALFSAGGLAVGAQCWEPAWPRQYESARCRIWRCRWEPLVAAGSPSTERRAWTWVCRSPGEGGGGTAHPLLPSPRFVGILQLVMSEGESMGDWSCIYLSSVGHIPPPWRALGFAAFSLAMLLGRLFGDRISARWGDRPMVQRGGLLAAGGLTLTLVSGVCLGRTHFPVFELLGFVAVGLGCASYWVSLAGPGGGNHLVTDCGVVSLQWAFWGTWAGPPLIGYKGILGWPAVGPGDRGAGQSAGFPLLVCGGQKEMILMNTPFRLAAIDLDGTLLGPDKRIHPDNAAAVRCLVSQGIEVVLASGRRFMSILRYQRELGPGRVRMVACQGCDVRDLRHQTVFQEFVPPSSGAGRHRVCPRPGRHYHRLCAGRNLGGAAATRSSSCTNCGPGRRSRTAAGPAALSPGRADLPS